MSVSRRKMKMHVKTLWRLFSTVTRFLPLSSFRTFYTLFYNTSMGNGEHASFINHTPTGHPFLSHSCETALSSPVLTVFIVRRTIVLKEAISAYHQHNSSCPGIVYIGTYAWESIVAAFRAGFEQGNASGDNNNISCIKLFNEWFNGLLCNDPDQYRSLGTAWLVCFIISIGERRSKEHHLQNMKTCVLSE